MKKKGVLIPPINLSEQHKHKEKRLVVKKEYNSARKHDPFSPCHPPYSTYPSGSLTHRITEPKKYLADSSRRLNPLSPKNYSKYKNNKHRTYPDVIPFDDTHQILYHSSLTEWVEEYKREEGSFGSTSLFLEMKTGELLNVTRRLNIPSKIRTTISADLILKLARSPQYEECLKPVLNILLEGTFEHFDPECKIEQLFRKKAYFELLELEKNKTQNLERTLQKFQLEKDLDPIDKADEDDPNARLLNLVLSNWRKEKMLLAFREWIHHITIKKQKVKNTIKHFQSFKLCRKKIFLRWRINIQAWKKRRQGNEIFETRKKLRILEAKLHQVVADSEKLKRQNVEHINDLLEEINDLKEAVSSVDNKRIFAQYEQKIHAKWVKYFCEHHEARVVAAEDAMLDMIDLNVYFDPLKLIELLERDAKNMNYVFPLLTINNMDTITGEDCILNWIAFKLSKGGLMLNNFSADLKNSKIYVMLLNRLFPKKCSLSIVEKNPDIKTRAIEVVQILNSIGANEGSLLCPIDIMEGRCDLNYVMLVRLMLLFPGISLEKKRFQVCFDECARIRVRLNKLRRSRKHREVESLHRMTDETNKVCMKINQATSEMQEFHAKWVKLVSRIAAGAQIFVTARMRDAPRVVNDQRERLAKKEFSTLEARLIEDILNKYPEPSYEYENLVPTLLRFQSPIRQAFVYYSAGGEGQNSTMSQGEWRKFIVDICVKGKGLGRKYVDQVFVLVNRDSDEDLQNQNFVSDDEGPELEEEEEEEQAMDEEFAAVDDNPDDMLVAYEFLEALVRIAHKKYRKQANTIARQVELLVTKHIIKNGSQCGMFRKRLETNEVEFVFQEFNAPLQKIFFYYSSLSHRYIDPQVAVNIVKGSLMRPQEFISMIKDCKLVSGALTNDILMNMFISLNRPFGIPSPFLCFDQFKEGLAVCACYKNPNPFNPLKAKLTYFLSVGIVDPLIRQGGMKNKLKR